MFGKVSLSQSRFVALNTAIHVIRGCWLDVLVDSDKSQDIASLTPNFCEITTRRGMYVGVETRTASVEIPYQYGKLCVSVTMALIEQKWQATAAKWSWLPSDQSSPVRRGKWFAKPIGYHCINCGFVASPRNFHNDTCSNCRGGQLVLDQ